MPPLKPPKCLALRASLTNKRVKIAMIRDLFGRVVGVAGHKLPDHRDHVGVAGYSGTPLAKKIGVQPGLEVLLRNAPSDWSVPGVPLSNVDIGEADIVVGFYRSRSELERDVAKMPTQLAKTAMWWVAWPRKAGGHTSDITENLLRELILPTGLVDVKVAALDNDWSGCKFVWRRENR